MPSRNILKKYADDGVYHIYNRGVERRDIFTDVPDYKTFLYFLKQYLLAEEDPKKDVKNFNGRESLRRSFFGRIELLAYCLMPNHFHLLIRQKNPNDMSEFMRCLGTSYSIYFNQRHDRVGGLFQGRYKAVLVEHDDQLLHLSRYIHLNPVAAGEHFGKGPDFVNLDGYDYSSYQDYIGLRDTKWVNANSVLGILDENASKSERQRVYKKFVEEFYRKSLVQDEAIARIVIE